MTNPIITIKPPPKSKPGWARRQREVVRIQEVLSKGPNLAAFDEMLDLMLKECEVTVPDGVDPREALLDLSEEDFDNVMTAMRGDKSTVPPTNGA